MFLGSGYQLVDNSKQFAHFSGARSTLVASVRHGSISSDPAAIQDPHSVTYQPSNGRKPEKKDDPESVLGAAAQGSALAFKLVVTALLRFLGSC